MLQTFKKTFSFLVRFLKNMFFTIFFQKRKKLSHVKQHLTKNTQTLFFQKLLRLWSKISKPGPIFCFLSKPTSAVTSSDDGYVIDEHLMAGDPICVKTRSSHWRGPLRWSSIQHGVDVTVWRRYSAPQPLTKLILMVHILKNESNESNSLEKLEVWSQVKPYTVM